MFTRKQRLEILRLPAGSDKLPKWLSSILCEIEGLKIVGDLKKVFRNEVSISRRSLEQDFNLFMAGMGLSYKEFGKYPKSVEILSGKYVVGCGDKILCFFDGKKEAEAYLQELRSVRKYLLKTEDVYELKGKPNTYGVYLVGDKEFDDIEKGRLQKYANIKMGRDLGICTAGMWNM